MHYKNFSKIVSQIFIFLVALMCAASLANAQGTSLAIVSFNLSNYSGGYNVTCNGATNGTFSITVAGGVTPYSYSWSNGATTPSITGIAAGAYTVTVTDASVSVATATLTATLLQPNLLTSTLTDVQHNGFDISCNGGNNGAITNTIGGGTAPYSFLWSDASVNQNYSNASAGSYSVNVTDMNNCSATATISMTQPSAITDTLTSPVNSFGFNTGCGIADGSVNLTVSGGVSTYTFSWNSGQHAQNLNYLLGGLYSVVITDQNGCTVNNTIAVISPPLLTAVNDSAVVYFNNANVSSDTSNDGIITAQPIGGTSPYTFQWSPGTFGTTQTITGCAALTGGTAALYSVTVTDSAGCQKSLKNIMLTPAGSTDWNITGNHGEVGFIGTLDSADMIFETNNTERMRIGANGNVNINANLSIDSLSFTDTSTYQNAYQMLIVDHNGNLKSLPNIIQWLPPCPSCPILCCNNDIWHPNLCNISTISNVGIGTYSPNSKLNIVADCGSTSALDVQDNSLNELMFVRNDGVVGIGVHNSTNIPVLSSTNPYQLYVLGGIRTEKVLVDVGTTNGWSDFVFDEKYKLMPLNDLKNFLIKYKHLPDIPTTKEVQTNGLDLTEINAKLLQKVEEAHLYIIDLQKQLDEIKEEMKKIKK